jgi:hypothetical protein
MERLLAIEEETKVEMDSNQYEIEAIRGKIDANQEENTNRCSCLPDEFRPGQNSDQPGKKKRRQRSRAAKKRWKTV